jgi:hypothetical protein
MTSLSEIAEALRHYPFSKAVVREGCKPVLQEVGIDAAERARALFEDMAAIGCTWPFRAMTVSEKLVLSYYEIPGTDFGKSDSEDVPDVFRAHGFGLNWGSLIRLSKVCEIGRRCFGADWPGRFKRKLLNPKDHLAFVEEMLWLNLWHDVSEIKPEAQPFLSAGCEKRVDWRFKSCGQVINLEVKYRPKDWMRHVDGSEVNIVMPDYYYDVPPKFPRRNDDEINVVAVSCPAPSDRSLQLRTEMFLRSNPTVDGVLIWSQVSQGTRPFEIHSLKNGELIKTLFTGGDFEDAAHVGIIRHLWRKRDERRAYRAEEIPELLQRLGEEARRAAVDQTRSYVGG